MFEEGFLGTQATLSMDLATIYFAILPLLLLFAISFAKNKAFKKHFYAQIIIFTITLVFLAIFEIGVRLDKGFMEYSENASLPFSFLFAFLTVHINIAIVTVVAWIYLIISSFKNFKHGDFELTSTAYAHRKIGQWVFLGITFNALMGLALYIMLFLL